MKVRAISRIIDEGNGAALVDMAAEMTSNEVERVVAAYRRCESTADDVEARAFAERACTFRVEDGSMVITTRLPVEPGAAVMACVDQFVGRADVDVPLERRCADAVVAMAEHAVATSERDGDGALVPATPARPIGDPEAVDELRRMPCRDSAGVDVPTGEVATWLHSHSNVSPGKSTAARRTGWSGERVKPRS